MTTISHRFLTEEEFCARYRVSRDAVHRFRTDSDDPVPCIRVGRRYLYDPAKVEAWAARRAKNSRSEHADRR